ncbi:hypothetical protein ANCCAN_28070 [Ancylostoma caninum]|uniref:Uncharacterized protein n=1 Tax=Ancylostoma caninum TaxID=29170 RepID=A0A368F5D8_ANCCA|nr:hypothetical protein ANCCAN_28070 [Ancylostoma caninum]
MADWISTLHDVSNGTTVELSTSEDTEGTQRRSTAPTATPSPGTLFPKPPQHRNQTELNGNATHDHLHFYKGNMDDILLTIALIGLCVLLVVLIIICLGIRNEKKQDQMRKELLRKDMEDEQRLFVEFGRHPIQTLPTPPKHQITPTYPREEIVAPKETKLDMGGKAPVTTAPPPTPLRSTEIEFQKYQTEGSHTNNKSEKYAIS